MGLTAEQRSRIRKARSEDARIKTGKVVTTRNKPVTEDGVVVRHGFYASYKAGCRCDECVLAHKNYNVAHRKVPCINAPKCKNLVWSHGNRSGMCRPCSNEVKSAKYRV